MYSLARELADDHDRSEALLLSDPHVVSYFGEYCRREEVPGTVDALPAVHQPGAFFDASLGELTNKTTIIIY